MLKPTALPFLARHVRFGGLAAILLLGVCLRAWSLEDSLWIDELHTAWTVAGDWSDVAWRARLGNNGPLYFWLVYGVTQLAGLDEWSLRLSSCVAGSALIVATYAVARNWQVRVGGSLLAAFLVAVDAHAIYYASEARPYALVQLVGLGHLYLFWRWTTDGKVRLSLLAAWLVTGLLLFYLHCTTAFVFLAELAAYTIAWFCLPQRYRGPRDVLAGFAALGTGMLPMYPLLHEVAQRRHNWELFVEKEPLWAVLTMYPLATYLMAPLVAVGGLWSVRSLLVGSGRSGEATSSEATSSETTSSETTSSETTSHEAGSCETASRETMSGGHLRRWPVVLCLSWLFVPLVAAWLATEWDIARLFFRRYVIASSVALAPLAALIQNVIAPTRRATMVAVLVGLVAVITVSPFKHTLAGFAALKHSAENWRDAVALLAADDAEVPILLRSGLIEADDWSHSSADDHRQYCLLPLRGIYSLPASGAPTIPLPTSLPVRLSAADKSRLAQYERAWVVIRDSRDRRAGKRVVQEVLAELDFQFLVSRQYRFGLVTVVELRRA